MLSRLAAAVVAAGDESFDEVAQERNDGADCTPHSNDAATTRYHSQKIRKMCL